MKKFFNISIMVLITYLYMCINIMAISESISNELPSKTGKIEGVRCTWSEGNRTCTGTVENPYDLAGSLDKFYTSVKYDENGVLFCTEHEETSPAASQTICDKNDEWSIPVRAGVAAIIQEGNGDWGTSEITDNYMLVTYSINQFLYDNEEGGQNVKVKYPLTAKNTEFNNYMTIAETAKQGTTNPTLTLSESTLTFTKKGGKYVSNEITITSNVDSYKINSPEDVIINKKGNTFTVSIDENDERIIIGTPFKIDITVSVQKTISQARNYTCGTYQSLTPANYEMLTLTETATASGEIVVNTSLTIRKQDDDKKILPGVVLKVESEENNYSETFTTTDKEIKIENLKFGKYTITEISVPDGYVKLKDPVDIVISDKKLNETVTLTNSLSRVEISKISSADSKLVKGAVLQIQDKDGNVIKNKEGKKYEWTTTEAVYEILGLPKGTYYLVEISSPEGYELNKERIEFEVDGKTKVIKVEIKNNVEVKVPDTLSNRSTLLITISMFDIFLGIGIIAYVKKNKVKE